MADPTFQGYSTYRDEQDSSVSSMTVTMDVTAGDLVLAIVQRNSMSSLTSVTLGSQSMTQLKAPGDGGGYGAYVYGALASSGGTGVSITASFSDSDQWGAMVALKWDNVASSTPSQSSCNSSGCNSLAASSTTRTAQSITTSGRRLLVAMGSDWDNWHTHTGANGFTKRWDSDVSSAGSIQFAYDQVANAGTFGGSSYFGTTDSGSDQYLSALLAFESTSASPTAVDMTDGTVGVSGHGMDISLPTAIALGVGSVSATGHAATIGSGTVIAMGTGSVSVGGLPASISVPTEILMASGSASVDGHSVSIGAGTGIACSSGSVSVSGHQQGIAFSTNIDMAAGAVSVQGAPASIGMSTMLAMGCGMVFSEGHAVSFDLPPANYGGIFISTRDRGRRKPRQYR